MPVSIAAAPAGVDERDLVLRDKDGDPHMLQDQASIAVNNLPLPHGPHMWQGLLHAVRGAVPFDCPPARLPHSTLDGYGTG